MNYYDVLVATKNKTNKTLTYVSETELVPCQIVKVPVRAQSCLGLVVEKTPAQKISQDLKTKCRPINQASFYRLPETLVRAALDFSRISSLSLSATAKLLLSNAVFKPTRKGLPAPETSQTKADKAPALNHDQAEVYRKIKASTTSHPQLILGVNGSGKTRVYAELIKDQIESGRSVLVLVPEIGLSAQILELLQNYLPFEINHFHSRLRAKQKKELWEKCQTQTQPLVIVGPRSAEFLPLKNLGLVILDEFHDDSFKQENQPSYHSLQLTSCLAKTHRAKIVCGSATPRTEDYYHFHKAAYPIYYLNKRALPQTTEPQTTVIDKKEFKQIFSPQALDEIIKTIKKKHQVLVFYNRRGHWRIVKCDQCSWQAECPACSRNLVFHREKFKLLCHGCGHAATPVSACPDCRQAIKYTYPGIKTITSELEKHLSENNLQPPIWRFDSDNLSRETLADKFDQIKDQSSLVILGTQVISQGFDLPNLQTVVILDADQSLVSPDYRSQERYYRHIHQLSGRVGRGHLKETKVLIQTRQPDNPVLQHALKQDWLKFYEEEIKSRYDYQLPPFVHFANISIRRNSSAATKKTALKLYEELSSQFKAIKFYQPAPALQEKHPRYWEWLIHASCPKRKPLIELADSFKDQEFFLNLDPNQLFASGR